MPFLTVPPPRFVPRPLVRFVVPALAAGLLWLSPVQAASQAASQATEPPAGYAAAMRWYEEQARAGNAKAQFLLGLSYEQGLRGAEPDAAEAARWYRKAAEQGHAPAQAKLALALQFGRGIPADAAEARRWYGKAAEQGLAEAQYNLAYLLESGLGGPRDSSRAVYWYEKAAAGGVAAALTALGGLHARGEGGGEGVPQNLHEAYKWLTLAAGAGQQGVSELLRRLGAEMNEAERLDAEASARRWLAEHGR
jgi:TPR repeat protein